MTHFLSTTLDDLRGGRESWRVRTALGLIAFVFSVALQLI